MPQATVVTQLPSSRYLRQICLPSSRGESFGDHCTKAGTDTSLSLWCKVYHASVFICCKFERDRWSQISTSRQKNSRSERPRRCHLDDGRFVRLPPVCFGQNLAIPNWSNVAIYIASCSNISKDSVAYKVEEIFGLKIITYNHKLLFSRMILYSPPVSCDINDITAINTIVKTCSVKIMTATKVKDTCINEPQLPTDLFEFINTPISCITTTDIDDVEGSNSYSLRDIAKCSTLPFENIPPSGLVKDDN